MHHYPRTVAAIAAASLMAAFAAQANKGADYKPSHHKEPHKNFFVTAGATYLEPSFTGLDYVQIQTQSTAPNSVINVNTEVVQPEFDWGYFIQAGYRISPHYDVQASWTQFNSHTDDSASATGASGVTTYIITSSNSHAASPGVGETATAHSEQTLDYSYFDANLGQYHNITEMLRARIFAGIAYGKVSADVDNTYTLSGSTTVYRDDYDSSFSGWGPELGMDLEYKIWHTVGVVGHVGAALLVGTIDSDSTVYYSGTQNPNQQVALDTDSTTRMVPAVNAKLGVNWNVPYHYEKVAFGIEAGYEVAYLWNAVDEVTFAENNESYAQHNRTDYGNMGPYLNFTAMF